MTNEKTEYGVMEAFSFRKGVVKISGKWIKFGPEAENSIKPLSKGDQVEYAVEGGKLKWIRKQTNQAKPAQAQSVAPRSATVPAPTVANPEKTASLFQDRNKSIERQVALKAAVELAGLYGYKSTKECLDVAASFANWIEATEPENVQFAARAAVNPSPSL